MALSSGGSQVNKRSDVCPRGFSLLSCACVARMSIRPEAHIIDVIIVVVIVIGTIKNRRAIFILGFVSDSRDNDSYHTRSRSAQC